MSNEPESSKVWLPTRDAIERLKALNIEYDWRIPPKVFNIEIPNVELGKNEILTPYFRFPGSSNYASPQQTLDLFLFALKKELAKIKIKVTFERNTFISNPTNIGLANPDHNSGIFGLMKFNFMNSIAREEIELSCLIEQKEILPPVFHSAAETILTMLIHINWVKNMGLKDFPNPIMAGYIFKRGNWKDIYYPCAYYCRYNHCLEFDEILSNVIVLGFAINTYEPVGKEIRY